MTEFLMKFFSFFAILAGCGFIMLSKNFGDDIIGIMIIIVNTYALVKISNLD